MHLKSGKIWFFKVTVLIHGYATRLATPRTQTNIGVKLTPLLFFRRLKTTHITRIIIIYFKNVQLQPTLTCDYNNINIYKFIFTRINQTIIKLMNYHQLSFYKYKFRYMRMTCDMCQLCGQPSGVIDNNYKMLQTGSSLSNLHK